MKVAITGTALYGLVRVRVTDGHAVGEAWCCGGAALPLGSQPLAAQAVPLAEELAHVESR